MQSASAPTRADEVGHRVGGELARLHGADVAEDERGRGDVADLVGVVLVAAEHGPLAAQAEAVAPLLGDGGEHLVDVARPAPCRRSWPR